MSLGPTSPLVTAREFSRVVGLGLHIAAGHPPAFGSSLASLAAGNSNPFCCVASAPESY